MNTIWRDIVIGTVSGIASSFVAYVFLVYVKKTIIPWYQQIIYKGIIISGEWYSTDTPFPQDIKLDLKQKASQLTGTATIINWPENQDDIEPIRTFRIEGSIADRFVRINLYHIDPSRIGIIMYLFEIRADGRMMQGASSHYDLKVCKISHADINFSRTKTQYQKRC